MKLPKKQKTATEPYAKVNFKSLMNFPKDPTMLYKNKRVKWALNGQELNLLAKNFMRLIESEQNKIKWYSRLLLLLYNDDWEHQTKPLPYAAPPLMPPSPYNEQGETLRLKPEDGSKNKKTNPIDPREDDANKIDSYIPSKLESTSHIQMSSPSFLPLGMRAGRIPDEEDPSEDPIQLLDNENYPEVENNQSYEQNQAMKPQDGLNVTVTHDNEPSNAQDISKVNPHLTTINQKLITLTESCLENSRHYIQLLQNTYQLLVHQAIKNSKLFEELETISKDDINESSS